MVDFSSEMCTACVDAVFFKERATHSLYFLTTLKICEKILNVNQTAKCAEDQAGVKTYHRIVGKRTGFLSSPRVYRSSFASLCQLT